MSETAMIELRERLKERAKIARRMSKEAYEKGGTDDEEWSKAFIKEGIAGACETIEKEIELAQWESYGKAIYWIAENVAPSRFIPTVTEWSVLPITRLTAFLFGVTSIKAAVDIVAMCDLPRESPPPRPTEVT